MCTSFHPSLKLLFGTSINLHQDPQFSQEPLSLSATSEAARASDEPLPQQPGDTITVNSGKQRQTGLSVAPAPSPPVTKPKKFSGFVFLGGTPNIEDSTEDGKSPSSMSMM